MYESYYAKDHQHTRVSSCLSLARIVVFSSPADADGSVSNMGPVSLLLIYVYYFKAILQILWNSLDTCVDKI